MKGKKAHAEDRTQIVTKLTAIFKFPRHPQKLVQKNNWCGMVTNFENTINRIFQKEFEFHNPYNQYNNDLYS
jgi:hypothetical protein